MTQAIFLSYASQDADAARRICEALRAAGLEVWFDQSELRGGDAWDASIRKQIKDCALFIPIISPNTQAREEGYFRLEWKLAVDRSHLMADNKAFFVPVMLGDVSEPAALVPDKFRERQWSRLNDNAAITTFAARVAKLLAGSASPANSASNSASAGHSGTVRPELVEGQGNNGDPSMCFDASTSSAQAELRMSGDLLIAQNNESRIIASGTDAPSIAVLAFANRSASADDEYFSDGLADELLNVLAKIKDLRVAARTSAFSFKGKQTTVAEIGRILNVGTVLEGSVRKSGNRVRISVQLIKVDDGFHLWSETYDRTLDDIFAVQDDIAQAVVQQLRTTLMGETASPVTVQEVAAEIAHANKTRSANPEAQRLILQARFYRQKRRPADIKRSIALSEEAVALDPHYAEAHASLADAWQAMSIYGVGQSNDVNTVLVYMNRARTAAVAALALDQTLALPHIILSWLACIFDHDRVTAMREAKLAEALAPNDAEVLRTLGHRLIEDGEFFEAEAILSRAVQLDPLLIQLRINYSILAQWGGRAEEALHRIREAIAIDESSWFAHWQLSSVLSGMGEYASAVEASAQSCALRGEHEGASYFRQQFANGGWQGYLAGIISAPQYAIAPIQVAWAQIELGLIDDAFATLDAMVDHYDQHTLALQHEPGLASLRGDPRFTALLKRAGFA